MEQSNLKTKYGSISFLYKEGQNSFLFIHGLGGTKHFFNEAFKYTSNGNSGILALDLLGFGDSEKFKDENKYSITNQVKAIFEVLEKLNINEINLVLHSMASIFIPEVLKRNKIEVKELTLLEGNILKSDADWSNSITLMNSDEFGSYSKKLNKHAARILEMQLKNKNAIKLLDENQRSSFSMLDPRALRFIAKKCTEITASEVLPSALKKFAGIKKYYRGELSDEWDGERLLKDANIEFIELNNAGHYLMLDNPDLLYKSILEC